MKLKAIIHFPEDILRTLLGAGPCVPEDAYSLPPNYWRDHYTGRVEEIREMREWPAVMAGLCHHR